MMYRQTHHPIEILLVEDNLDDIFFTQEALAEGRVANTLHVVKDGVEAMAFLQREGDYINKPLPHLILLDINLPRKSGQEVLVEIKTNMELRTIPVVILTTSAAEQDIFNSYQSHANCYIVKPVDLDKFSEVIKSIETFWFSIVTLPLH